MKMSKTAAVKLINELFRAIPYISAGWGDLSGKLYDMNEAAEKQHRKGYAGRTIKGFPVSVAAKYFTVSHLFEALEKPGRYTLADILHIRLECLYAQAYAAEHAEALKEWHALVKASQWEDVDYAELMQ